VKKKTCFNKEFQPNLKLKNKLSSPYFYTIQNKSLQFISSLQYRKKKLNRKKKSKEENNKIENIFKKKNLRERN
jgi:hypothetical protein